MILILVHIYDLPSEPALCGRRNVPIRYSAPTLAAAQRQAEYIKADGTGVGDVKVCPKCESEWSA